MKKRKLILAAFTMLFLAAISGNTKVSRAEEQTAPIKAPLNLHVVKKSATALQLSWNPVEKADGYEIYRCPAGKHSYKRVKVIKNPVQGIWLNKKLKKNKTYKYRIKAYTILNGTKVLSKYAYTVSAKTYTKKSRTVNVNLVETDTYLLETDFGEPLRFSFSSCVSKTSSSSLVLRQNIPLTVGDFKPVILRMRRQLNES